jgi:hypothetical protein
MDQLHQRCRTVREIANSYYRKNQAPTGEKPEQAAGPEVQTTVLVATLAASLATLIIDFAGRPTPMIGILIRMIKNGVDLNMPRPLWDALVAIAEMDPSAPEWIRRDILNMN